LAVNQGLVPSVGDYLLACCLSSGQVSVRLPQERRHPYNWQGRRRAAGERVRARGHVSSALRAIVGIPLFDSVAARRKACLGSAAAIVMVALLDWKVTPNLTLGFLYIFPILVLSVFARRWQIAVLALACGGLREVLSPFAWDGDAAARVFMGVVAFAGAGLFVSELARNRRLAVQHAQELKTQIHLRQEVEEELRVLVESSPAAIFTLDAEGRVLLANDAAGRLLAFEGGLRRGESVAAYLPALVSALDRPHSLFRTNMECVGRRRDGEVFLAHAWFSTYHTLAGARLAAIVLDASEQLRDREVSGLGSVAAASRVLFGAVSHEVRNLAAAASVACANLARTPGLAQNEDLEALGGLVEGLERIASCELRLGANVDAPSIDLRDVLDQLRIVLEPALREDGISLQWQVPLALPRVLADPHSLLQIFLNLAQNSQREMASQREKVLTVIASAGGASVTVRFVDSGPGVRSPEKLFQAFGRGGEGSGLGLFVSRTIARSFAGDLRHEPRPHGTCFAVELARGSISMTA
jgi:signal transduction histidine kinase